MDRNYYFSCNHIMSESLVSLRLLVDPCNYVKEELIIVYTPSLEKLILQEKGNGPRII
jgi:hypothetical protein